MMPHLHPYLQLCRLPTVFTAMADIFLGYLLVHDGIITVDGNLTEFILLLGASSCLYLSGMVWNDVADREIDAVERPQRPIPSGRVSVSAATVLASGLMVTGLLLAELAQLGGGESFFLATALTIPILAYNFGLKKTVLGPLAMGACRFHNVLLGASTAATSFADAFSQPQLWVAAGLGVYIVGVTWFARTEAKVSHRGQLIGAMVVVNLGLGGLIGWIATSPGDNRPTVLLAMAIIALTINRRLWGAIAEPVPQRVQTAIKTMLLSIIMLDATLIAHRLGADGAGYAMATASLLIPAMFLGRWLKMT